MIKTFNGISSAYAIVLSILELPSLHGCLMNFVFVVGLIQI